MVYSVDMQVSGCVIIARSVCNFTGIIDVDRYTKVRLRSIFEDSGLLGCYVVLLGK